MDRRGFFSRMVGSVAALVGIGKVTADDSPMRRLQETMKTASKGRHASEEELITDLFKKATFHVMWGHHRLDLLSLLARPNPSQTFGELAAAWVQQRLSTGVALTWMVPNQLDKPMELHVIPTVGAIPHSAITDYPDGYYRVEPVYPFDTRERVFTPIKVVGSPIPAQWMMQSVAEPIGVASTIECERLILSKTLTKYLAPHFGADLRIEVSLPQR